MIRPTKGPHGANCICAFCEDKRPGPALPLTAEGLAADIEQELREGDHAPAFVRRARGWADVFRTTITHQTSRKERAR